MANQSFAIELTAEEVARIVTGLEASSAAITAAIASDAEFNEKRIEVIKNLRFIDNALANESIREAANVEALQTIRAEALEALRPPVPATPAVNPLLVQLEELGL